MPQSPEDQLRETFEVTLPEMVRTRNIKGYVSLYTEDGVWSPPNRQNRYGRKDIGEGVADLLSTENIDPVFTANDIAVRGDIGYVWGWSKQNIIPLDGQPSYLVYSQEIWLFRRVGERYLISHLAFNDKQSQSQLEPPVTGE